MRGIKIRQQDFALKMLGGGGLMREGGGGAYLRDTTVPSKPAYRVAISQLVRYLRICCNCQDFARSKLLTTRLLRHGNVYQKLCSTYKTFVHRYPMTLQKYGRCLKNIITECIALPTV